jgi:hypothetical protein
MYRKVVRNREAGSATSGTTCSYREQGRAGTIPDGLVYELQDRFMLHRSNSLINWILNLRAYGARLRDNPTSSGFIY